MLNNKGQSLVLFILIIPILLAVMALVVDVGNALIKKNEMENTIEFVINYGLEEKKEVDELQQLLNYNLVNCDNVLEIDNGKIIATSNTYLDGIFSNILSIKGFRVVSSYQGYIDEDRIIIERIK